MASVWVFVVNIKNGASVCRLTTFCLTQQRNLSQQQADRQGVQQTSHDSAQRIGYDGGLALPLRG